MKDKPRFKVPYCDTPGCGEYATVRQAKPVDWVSSGDSEAQAPREYESACDKHSRPHHPRTFRFR